MTTVATRSKTWVGLGLSKFLSDFQSYKSHVRMHFLCVVLSYADRGLGEGLICHLCKPPKYIYTVEGK
jgi:hypothetical protein